MERHMYVVVLIYLLFQSGVSQNEGTDCVFIKAELEKSMSNYTGQVQTILDYLSGSLLAGPASLNNVTSKCDCGADKPDANTTATITDGRSLMVFTTGEVKDTEIICEHITRTIECTSGVLNISYANGRSDSKLCPHKSNRATNCSAESSESYVMSRCNVKKLCTLTASNHIFGDPCHSTFKHLEVTYTCVVALVP